ncbi:hypothetical protein PV646_18080 [Streptomyces sp. ID05-26A]|nr:hypothetical protein [Streptomyces sp. ID05-26A]
MAPHQQPRADSKGIDTSWTGSPSAAIRSVVVIPSVTPVPVTPHWDHDERLSRVDLMGVGTRFRAAAVATTSPALRDVLLDAAERLFVTAGERL